MSQTPRITAEDKTALSALKQCQKAHASPAERDKAKALIEKARASVKDSRCAEAFGRVAEYLLTRKRMQEIGQTLTPPVDDTLSMGRTGLLQSAEFAWAEI